MSRSQFLVDALPNGDEFVLDGPEGRHAAAVQRIGPGEELLLADGRGATAEAVVTGAGKNSLTLTIRSRAYESAPDPRLVVVQGIAKGDRGELAVQAMTEVGVDEIVPWAATRSVSRWRAERGDKARDRWVATAREAAKQSRRAWCPTIAGDPDESTRVVAARLGAAAAAFVLHEEATTPLATAALPTHGDVLLVVGPEGGITPDEVAAFEEAAATPVRLGPTVLRTSTAGVAALSVLSARLGRWG
ncbi:16S rRNA (uracil(1498)-N(3))-methyltransferase [Asanoa sp. NPDC049518]|uniref:16S rRNA (uracil(1498)-N(3))-methyltransferase n=1 Tax=unclassified Asanoa TaxID=2685164 RepID=UPI00343B99A3